jgi:uncharacterized membrane protein
MHRLLAFLTLAAGAAAAQDYPALHSVTGVAGDDILNVRTRPMAQANVIGTLAPDAEGIEVIAEENGWGQLNVDGQSGWANLSFLSRVEGSALPQAPRFTCFGTEPFWSLSVTPGADAVFSVPEGVDRAFSLSPLTTASGRFQPFAALGSASGGTLALVVAEEACSDGMSDNRFGLSTTVVLGGYDTQVYSGCCSLAAH